MRLARLQRKDVTFKVSTHAPVKGATQMPSQSICSPWGFNPRTREGCDHRAFAFQVGRQRFNPRTREGCDTAAPMLIHSHARFNPRTREGCDPQSAQWTQRTARFNPRTREGCDTPQRDIPEGFYRRPLFRESVGLSMRKGAKCVALRGDVCDCRLLSNREPAGIFRCI